jgi:prepilin-type N-terminal cleavage/methylation domain-containing protein
MIRDQRGVTLIELLVTLMILSSIGGIIWSVFFQGSKFTQNSISKNTTQQEANILITTLKRIHQTSKNYTVNSSACKVTVTATKQDNTTKNYEFKATNLCISIDHAGTVIPDNNDISIKLTIYDINNTNNRVEINAILYRLKDGGI